MSLLNHSFMQNNRKTNEPVLKKRCHRRMEGHLYRAELIGRSGTDGGAKTRSLVTLILRLFCKQNVKNKYQGFRFEYGLFQSNLLDLVISPANQRLNLCFYYLNEFIVYLLVITLYIFVFLNALFKPFLSILFYP